MQTLQSTNPNFNTELDGSDGTVFPVLTLQSAKPTLNSELDGPGGAPSLLRLVSRTASDASIRSSSPKQSLTTRWGTHAIATPSTTKNTWTCSTTPNTSPSRASTFSDVCSGLFSDEELVFCSQEEAFGEDFAFSSQGEVFGEDDVDYESVRPMDGSSSLTTEIHSKQYTADIPEFLSSKDNNVMSPVETCALPRGEMRRYDGPNFSSGYCSVIPPPPGLEPTQHIVATRPLSFRTADSCQQLPSPHGQSGPFQNTLYPPQFGPKSMIQFQGPLAYVGPAPLDYGRCEAQGRAMMPTLGDFRGTGPIGNTLGDFRSAAPIGKSHGKFPSAEPMRNSLEHFHDLVPMRNSLDDFHGTWPSQESTPEDAERLSLADILSTFANEDTNTLVVVRRTYKLGFDGKTAVYRYFSQFGPVARVLLCHNTKGNSANASRCRCPSGLGFVQMQSAADAQRVISQGSEQMINNVLLRVLKFETRLSARTTFSKRSPVGAKRCRKQGS